MALLTSQPYPDANKVVMALLADLGPVVLRAPTDFAPPLIVVKRIGGQPDAEDVTDYPIMLVAVHGADYDAAADLMARVQVRILSSPLTGVSYVTDADVVPVVHTVCIDSAGLHVGDAEVPDVYIDDRRITSTYQFGWRRTYPH